MLCGVARCSHLWWCGGAWLAHFHVLRQDEQLVIRGRHPAAVIRTAQHAPTVHTLEVALLHLEAVVQAAANRLCAGGGGGGRVRVSVVAVGSRDSSAP